MTHHIFSGIGMLATGAVAGALLLTAYNQFDSQPPATHPSQVSAAVTLPFEEHSTEYTKYMESMEEELNHYREWAFQLENQVIEMESRLHALEEAAGAPTSQTVAVTAGETATRDSGDASPATDGVLSVAALVNNGLDPQLAAEIVERKNRLELQQLELRDQAIRDGTFGQKAYFKALRELKGGAPDLRVEFGDNAYDRYLYTLGEPNRVIVTSVIPGSPAEQAGILEGDIILTYDNKRIFNWSELRNATSEGERGEYIPVNIQRNNTRIGLLLPRGPLGIRMSNQRYDPNID